MAPWLVTDRIELHPLCLDHLEDIFELHSHPDVMRYIGNDRVCANLAEARKILDRMMGYDDRSPHFGYWAGIERASGQFLGWFALKDLDGTPEIEVGYRLKPNFWCQGFATEMTRSLIEYGWDRCHLTRIVGITHPSNKASQKVLQKCGLKFEKIANYYNTDVYYYAIESRNI